ncbi:MAG: hypothetical protein U0271_29835 [Polyangiaceae bacterium]
MSRLVAARAGVALLAFAAGCNLVLGIDTSEYDDAAAILCACPDVSKVVTDCETRVRDSLDAADEKTRESWLSNFDNLGCDQCDEDGLIRCFQAEPVCKSIGESCSWVFDCCGTIQGTTVCKGTGQTYECAACVQVGDACTRDDECCGGLFSPGEAYCASGSCVAEPPSCKHSFDDCTTDADCCGSESGSAFCGNINPDQPGTYCIERCVGDAASNCPGCCLRFEGTGLPGESVCIDGSKAAAFLDSVTGTSTACEITCFLGVDEECPAGKVCQGIPVDSGGIVEICAPPM